MASQIAIKMLGTNGGGYVNANAAHPFENPTPLSNFFQMLSIFSIGSGLTYYLGRMVKNQKHGWTVWAAMLALFVGGVLLCWWAESNGNPIHQHLGVAAADGNMEGKEVRFGIFNSASFATITTDASCGAVNSMHDSFTRARRFCSAVQHSTRRNHLWRSRRGSLRDARLCRARGVHRRPDGRPHSGISRQENRSLRREDGDAVVAHPRDRHPRFAAWAVVSKWGLAGLNNNGPHGLSEILYAFSSGTGNNGSAFAGLSANTPWYNTTLGLAHVVRPVSHDRADPGAGRFVSPEKSHAASAGTFPVHGGTFFILLIGTVLLIGALNFLPALTLGPVVEHFLMLRGKLF